MGYRLGVLLIHGIGNQREDFANPMIFELQKHLQDHGMANNLVCFRPVWWAPVLDSREALLWQHCVLERRLHWLLPRSFVINVLADAIAYQNASATNQGNGMANIYAKIHNCIGENMRDLWAMLSSGPQTRAATVPLVIIAHSLGCHMISNYIWDVRHRKKLKGVIQPENAFERFETLVSLIMLGCNIPLFTLPYTNLEPIEFPSPRVRRCFPKAAEPKLREVTQWLNFYDRDDVMSYPLKPLSNKFNRAVTRDIDVTVGSLFTCWNPFCHTAYWTDRQVIHPVAELLVDLLQLMGA